MIAAGEVVQRPASVVKELMENAVDAGATDIKVVVADAGRTLIQVIDNGCGMTPDEAVLCFERHATSKLASAEDLHHILTFGFRGEALASIVAVAEVTLRTRQAGEELGVEVSMAASENKGTREVSCPVGTNIAVRKDCRGQGIGRALTAALMQYAANLGVVYMTLEVRRSNEIAQHVYLSHGFIQVSVRKKYYEDNGEDALFMVCDHMPPADPDFEEPETVRE